MGDGITLDKVNVEIESNSSKASSGIDQLTESIKKLKDISSSGINQLSNLSNTIKEISNNFTGLNSASSKINKTKESLSGLANTANNISNRFSGMNIDTSSTEQYGKLIKEQIVNGRTQAKTYKQVKDGIETVTNVTGKAITQTQKYVKEQNKLSKAFNLLKGTAIFGILKTMFNKIGSLVEGSSQYISNMNYFNTTMGTMRDEAKQFVNTMEKDFYLDPSNVMNYMASFNSLISGFGIANDEAYKMSKNLTQLSYDLAAFKGLSIEDAMQKIKSGISGELEPMRAIGVALDQATLQETAYDLGIKKRVSTMTRAQKTELLYYQMMKSTAQAQNYFASTLAKSTSQLDGSTKLILNPATALSLLKQQFSQLGRAIGNIFIPILTKLIPYVMAATQILTEFAQSIAAAFGFKLEDYNFSSSIGNVSSGIDGIGNSADKAGKKIKGMLAPFDELNTIDFGDKNGSGSDSAIGGGSLGIPIESYDWLKNEELTKKVENIKKKFEDMLPIIKTIGAMLLTWKVGSALINFFDKLGMITDKPQALKALFGLTLLIGGLILMYNGLKKVMSGDVSPQSILEVVFAGVATYIGTSFLFKVPVKGSITLLLALNIVLLTSIIGWWNKYYDQVKKELYNNKKELNLGEFINVSLTSIGTGVGDFLDGLFGENFTQGISDWFSKHNIANDILGVVLQLFTGADLEGFKTVGGQIADNIMDGMYKMLTGKTVVKKIGGAIEFITGIFRNDIKKMLLFLADIFEGIPIVGDAIATAIRAGVAASETDMSNTIKYTSEEALKDANPWVRTKSEKLGRDSITAYNSGISNSESNITSALNRTTNNAIDDSQPVIDERIKKLARGSNNVLKTNIDGTTAGRKVITSLKSGTENKEVNQNLNNRLKTIANSSNSTLKTNVNANSAGRKAIQTLESGTKDKNATKNLNSRLSTVGSDVKKQLSRKTNTTSVGTNIISGINSGMKKSTGSKATIWGTIGSIASKIVIKFAKNLGIHSPSTVMRDYVGKFIPLGISEGIKNESKSVYDSINELTNGVVDISSANISSIVGVTYDDINGNIQSQTEVISNISSSDFANKVGQYCYNAITQGFNDNPQNVNVNIGNEKIYSGYGSYQNKQSNKYGVSTITV